MAYQWAPGYTSQPGPRRTADSAAPYVVIPPYAVSTPGTTGNTHTGRPRSSPSTNPVPNRPVSRQHGYSTVQEQSGGAHYREQDAILHGGNLAAQTQVQRHRSLQASKQMLYDVYAQNIGMLEKLEELEHGGSRIAGHVYSTRPGSRNSTSTRHHSSTSTSHLPQNRGQAVGWTGPVLGKSDVTLPDQSHKTERDLKAIMDAELTCLQAQLKVCPPEVREQTRDELVQKTLGWVAEREEKGATRDMVDKYASKVVETLLTGQTSRDTSRRPTTADREAVLAGVRALQMGQHYGSEQDRSFHGDPARQARCPRIRSGEIPYVTGAKRVLDVHPNLAPHLSGQYYSGSQR